MVASKEANALNATILQSENERLRTLLIQYQEAAKIRESTALNPHKVLSLNEVLSAKLLEENSDVPEMETPVYRRASFAGAIIFFIVLAGTAALAYKFRAKLGFGKSRTGTTIQPSAQSPVVKLDQYKVLAPKAYFHNAPDENTRRMAWMINSNDTINALKETPDFIYTEFFNSKNQLSKGWLRKKDLVTLDKSVNGFNNSLPSVNAENNITKLELVRAARFLSNGKNREGLTIYGRLAKSGVTEAMYQYGDLALKGKNTAISCKQGIDWLNKAARKNSTAAKRTLGFLYMFANNQDILTASDYGYCSVQRDSARGAAFLIDAVSEGDTLAIRFLEQMHKR
ncbi:MAG: hypothetical protein WKI04_04255 [Ferruginibacter sp.]